MATARNLITEALRTVGAIGAIEIPSDEEIDQYRDIN